MLRSEHRLDSLLSRESIFLANNLVLVALCFVIFWGTYFPLISEALTGHEASVGPPWFDRYTVPLALVLVLLSGIGPVIAWRRATLANARRNFLAPLLRRAARARRAARWPASRTSRSRSRCSAARRSCSAASGRSSSAACARGARWPARRRRSRCWRSCGATAGATAATSCTSAWPCCSSASPPPRPSSTPSSWRSRPGSPRASAPTRSATCARRRRSRPRTTRPTPARRSASARSLDVSKHGRHVAHAAPERGLLRLRRTRARGRSGSLIGGQPVSHVSMNAGVTRDVWSAIAAEHRSARAAADRDGRQPHAAARRGRRGDRLPRARLPEAPAAGAVPLHRLAAGHVDLDRRPDRVRRRPDRDLAGAERRAPPRQRCARARAPRTAWRAPDAAHGPTGSAHRGCARR